MITVKKTQKVFATLLIAGALALFGCADSGSNSDDDESIAAALEQLVDEFQETGTYTVAFALGWISEDPAPNGTYDGSGRLYSVAPHPPVLSSASMTQTDIVNAVTDTMVAVPPSDSLADGGEAGLYSLNKLLTDYQSEARALGFLRPGAAFVVIFLSDENDI